MDGILRKLPIGIQTFAEIRKENYLYVDKTAFVWRIANTGKPYFEGKKELFEGLAIAGMEKEWRKYPVLHLDLNAKKYGNSDDLLAMLNQHLEKWETVYGD